MRSGLPGVNYGHTCWLKVIHVAGHNRHAVNKGSGRDESVTIGARTGHVERRAPLGNSSINRKDATVERGQNMAVHPIWVVAESSQYDYGIVFSDYGFAPERPWGLFFSSHDNFDADYCWYPSVEETYKESRLVEEFQKRQQSS